MTTAPNELTSSINHERSPVLLTTDADFETWMHGDEDAARKLLRPYQASAMQIVQEGFEKKDLLSPV